MAIYKAPFKRQQFGESDERLRWPSSPSDHCLNKKEYYLNSLIQNSATRTVTHFTKGKILVFLLSQQILIGSGCVSSQIHFDLLPDSPLHLTGQILMSLSLPWNSFYWLSLLEFPSLLFIRSSYLFTAHASYYQFF